MSVLRVVEPVEAWPSDPVVARLDVVLAELGTLVADGRPASDASRIDRLDRLTRIRSAVAAAEAAEIVRFAQSQTAQQVAAEVHPKRIGRGVADQIALACRVSPFQGSRRLEVARALWFELPQTFAQLSRGAVHERVADHVVSETRHLDPVQRQAVDAKVNAAGIETMGVRAAAFCVRKHSYEADPVGYVRRGRTERKHRRVSIRSAPDTMALLTGYLPVEQCVACWAALRHRTDALKAAGDERNRDQIMADLLVERLTGQARAEDVNVEVQLTMPLDSLRDSRLEQAAQLAGFGPLPGPIAREIVRTSRGRRWWRRLFTRSSGVSEAAVVGGDPRRRRFDGWLAKLIALRDQTCRDPYCDAPIRHTDHVVPFRAGGPTTLANGRGVCFRGNLVREMPGWRVDLGRPGLCGRSHLVVVTTPTGHRYSSEAPQPP